MVGRTHARCARKYYRHGLRCLHGTIMDYQTPLVLMGFSVVLLFALLCSLMCAIAPRKAILIHARFSTLVNDESASNRRVILQYRTMGALLTCFLGLFQLIVIGKWIEFLTSR